MDLGLANKHVFLTGASGGIGLSTAELFLKCGSKVSLHYNTNPTTLEDIQKRYGPHVLLVKADATDEPEVASCFRMSREKFGAVDVLVLNHGVFPARDVPLTEMSLEQFRSTLDINLVGCFLFAREFFRQIESSQSDVAVVIVGSTSGMFGERGHVDYSSSKSALMYGFMRTLKNEIYHHHPRGRVNCVAPGWVLTPMAQEAVRSDAAVLDRACQTIAMRKVASPSDVANAIVFLSSPTAAGHISGETLEVTGGMEGRLLHPPP